MVKINNLFKRKKIHFCSNDNAQMITLMGVILVVSVFVISSIASEMENIELIVKTDDYSSLANDFNMIKQTFGVSLNYNLIDIRLNYGEGLSDNECKMIGEINNISTAFEQTVKDYYGIELRYGKIFDASLNRYWCVNSEYGTNKVDITLYLEDSAGSISESVVYLIVCKPK